MAEFKVRTLLLDLDGTLLGSRPKLHLSFIVGAMKFFTKRGIGPVKALKALHALRKGVETHEPDACNSVRGVRKMSQVLGVDESTGRAMALELVQNVFPRLENCFFPITGAGEFIDWARARFPLVLATNAVWPREIVVLRVKWAGIDPSVFTFIANNDELHHCKPSVKYYEELIAKLKINPSESLMIGDSARKDLPAKFAGVPVFLLSNDKQATIVEPQVWKGNFSALKTFLNERSA